MTHIILQFKSQRLEATQSITKLTQDIERVKLECSERVSSLQADAKSKEREYEALLNQTRERYRRLESSHESLQHDLSTREKKSMDLQHSLDKARADLSNLQSECSMLKKQLVEAQLSLTQQNQQLQNKQSDLNKMEVESKHAVSQLQLKYDYERVTEKRRIEQMEDEHSRRVAALTRERDQALRHLLQIRQRLQESSIPSSLLAAITASSAVR